MGNPAGASARRSLPDAADAAHAVMLARIIYQLAPVLVFGVAAFALFHAWGAVQSVRAGNVPFALFYGVLAIGGVALAIALWRTRRQVDRSRREREK